MSNGNTGNGNGNGAVAGNRPRQQFVMQRLYLKDVSFEAPNAPAIFDEALGSPDIKLNLRTSQRDLQNGVQEVSLHISAHATLKDKTVFLVEVEQAGTFLVTGYTPEETRVIVGVACPNTLFPYAREAISSLVQRGGFPPLYLQPIDFAGLYATQAQQQQAAGQA
jgi:preprotein translocase subunit SecB